MCSILRNNFYLKWNVYIAEARYHSQMRVIANPVIHILPIGGDLMVGQGSARI